MQMVSYAGRGFLTSSDCILGRWKEYFEYLHNSINMHSMEEAASEDSGVGSLINGFEVDEAV